MSKYIIDIPDGIEWGVITCRTEDGFYNRDFDFLEELNSDYINEHFGEMQDEAYQRGLEDGKWKAEDGCDGCKYYGDTSLTNPCSECSRGCVDHYKPASDPDRIEVGDEVETKDGKRFVVTTFGSSFDGDIAVGVCADGLGLGVDLKELRKTGKHYDIASILEAMRQ